VNAGPVLAPAGVEALRDAPLAWALLIGGGIVFVAVMLLLLLAAGPTERPLRPRWWLVGGGLVFPGLVLAALQAFNLRHIDRLPDPVSADVLVVALSGRLWWWELRYVDPASGRPVVTANELRLPVGRPVRLGLQSDEVIHSLWIPALAGKVDLVPGRVAQLQLQVDRAGVWRAPCAEFCGEPHARMVLHAVAQAPAEFDAWLANQARPAREPASAIEARGRDAFVALRCVSCHTVRGVGSAVVPGPDLTHVASRLYIGAGTLPNDPASLRAWIAAVQAHKPGARMPSFDSLDRPTLDALAAYLASLR
jgi:cytochrome c oxidase subunit 2